MQLAWNAASGPSAVYAALCTIRLDAKPPSFLSDEFAATANQLAELLPDQQSWFSVLLSAIRSGNESQSGQSLSNGDARIAGAVRAVCTGYIACVPDFQQQVGLRLGPLQQQWEAYGPGLLRQTLAATSCSFDDYLNSSLNDHRAIQITPVLPIFGGAGVHIEPVIVMEAVLANANPLLPEVLRLAWLVAVSICHAQGADESPTNLIPHVVEAGSDMGLTARVEEATAAAQQDWLRLRFDATS